MTPFHMVLMLGCTTSYWTQIVGSYVLPIVTLESCNGMAVTFRVDNMTSGGLIYIRRYQAYNVLPTIDGTMTYACDFEDCDITFNIKFTLIIQQRVIIQTNNDVHQTFICMKDINPALSVLSRGAGSDTSNLTRITYTPEAAMTFSSNGRDLPGGSIVKLGRIIDITIALTNNFEGMFDISIRHCTMSTITLIDAYCPVHEDIFGAFTKLTVGNFTNTFEMFRPTTTLGGTLNVIFTCVLELCMGVCTQGCTTVTARRRRDDDDTMKLDDGREVNDDNLYVGHMFTVVTEEETEDKVQAPTGQPFCIHVLALSVIFGVLGALFLAAASLLSYVSINYLRHDSRDTNGAKPEPDKENETSGIKEHRKISPQSSCSSVEDGEAQTNTKHNVSKPAENQGDNGESINNQESIVSNTSENETSLKASTIGKENHGYRNDERCESPVLYTNKPRRRSRNIEIPLIHLQNIIAKIMPNSGAADGVIMYKGIKQDQSQTPESNMSHVHTNQNCSAKTF